MIIVNDCKHCYHLFRGAILMVVPDGHVVVKCCKCSNRRTMHSDHFMEWEGSRELGLRPHRMDEGHSDPHRPYGQPRLPKYRLSSDEARWPSGRRERSWSIATH